ncbi:MAG: folylpolyglutamate synthase/dihydrofolate synthase family protein [Candidatus Saccharicenans sp.]|nr:folylpolyglutamate synthase/dihydrofolate synthase family protein [Candidatus Saccharicenans sp.]
MSDVLDYPYLQRACFFGIKLGLKNISEVLKSCSQPELSFPSIQVAGTNGKGSVCAMLDQIFRTNGFRTGLYTSPHLADVRERIQVNGQMISEQDLKRILAEIEKKEKKLKASGLIAGSLTYFEILTITALLYFQEKKVDLAVLEVGMGGRFDATNVTKPEVAVITTIAYDHQQYLGNSLEKIAFEKAGIIKEKTPCVCGVKNRRALKVIKNKCQQVKAAFIPVCGQGRTLSWTETGEGLVFSYKTRSGSYQFKPSLAGRHQGENAATAIATTEVMGKLGWKLEKDKIIQALENITWPGRLEIISSYPLIILDGCHNEEGARAVSEFWQSRIKQPGILVFGVMKDKDIEKIARWLFPLAARVILTKPPMERAASGEELVDRLKRYRDKCLIIEEQVPSAMRQALALSGGQVPVLVAGSLFLIAEVRKFLEYYKKATRQPCQ